MKAEYTIKIDGVFYKAGDELPTIQEDKIEETKAAIVEPPTVSTQDEEPVEKPKEKRKYTRRR